MIANRIKLLRKRYGLSQQRLAEKARLSLGSITHLEQGIVQQPAIQTMIKIADALNISLDELVGRDFKPPKK